MHIHRSLARRLLALGAALLTAMLLLAACGGGEEKLEKVILALDWFPNADHAGIYAAQAQGFFEDEGLEVELQVPGNPEDPPKFVATGRADFAISYEPDIILAKAEGIPITAVAAIVPVPLNSIQTLKSSGITSPAQLEGKTIGYPGIPANRVYLDTILRNVGVDPSSIVLVDVGFDLSPAMRGRQVDATIGTYWNVEAVLADLENYPVNIMHLEDWGVPIYDELVFVVSEESVKERKDMIHRFLRAVARGHQYAVEHPDEATDAVFDANPEMRRDLIDQGVQLLVPLWAGMQPFGQMDVEKWEAFVDFLYDNQLIANRPSLDTLLTNEFIPK